MFHAQVLAQRLLESIMERTPVGEYLAVPYFLQIGNELRQTRQFRARDINRCRLSGVFHDFLDSSKSAAVISKDSAGNPAHQRLHMRRSACTKAAPISSAW